MEINIEPRIEEVSEKKLIGNRLVMSLSEDRTKELWQGFMTRRNEISNAITSDFISMQVYDSRMSFYEFKETTIFEKWAVVEVKNFLSMPKGMRSYTLFGGLYAVFIHKGLPSDFPKTAQYIHEVWLPQSDYELDHREHFEVLGQKYKNNDPSSEEEIWVPIKR
ncbi:MULTISPECIES: GyrI-like domain-containing protein [Arenibacter]|uniref:GyrI-like domain-containing protein n=1 Tax=Arenibacter TaxID=178469 RepID=UPI001EFD0A02|nr:MULTISPECIES: GyrI-like domain-containing protein [Arenibacter]